MTELKYEIIIYNKTDGKTTSKRIRVSGYEWESMKYTLFYWGTFCSKRIACEMQQCQSEIMCSVGKKGMIKLCPICNCPLTHLDGEFEQWICTECNESEKV